MEVHLGASERTSTIPILLHLLYASSHDAVLSTLSCCLVAYGIQEAMENFVFPDEIKTKLMKMSKLMNIFMSHKIMRNHSKAVLLFTDICFFAQLSLQLFGVKTWNC